MAVREDLLRIDCDPLNEESQPPSITLSLLISKMRDSKPMHPMGIYSRGGYHDRIEDDTGKKIRIFMESFENYLKEAGLPIVHDESTEKFWMEMKYYFDHFVRNDKPLGIVEMLAGAGNFLFKRREKYRTLVSAKIKSSPPVQKTGIPLKSVLSRVRNGVSETFKGLFA